MNVTAITDLCLTVEATDITSSRADQPVTYIPDKTKADYSNTPTFVDTPPTSTQVRMPVFIIPASSGSPVPVTTSAKADQPVTVIPVETVTTGSAVTSDKIGQPVHYVVKATDGSSGGGGGSGGSGTLMGVGGDAISGVGGDPVSGVGG